jgi:hypothetical protein
MKPPRLPSASPAQKDLTGTFIAVAGRVQPLGWPCGRRQAWACGWRTTLPCAARYPHRTNAAIWPVLEGMAQQLDQRVEADLAQAQGATLSHQLFRLAEFVAGTI